MRLIDADALDKTLDFFYKDAMVCSPSSVKGIVDTEPTISQFGKWISVKDRLPEYQEKVLCFYENGFMGTAVFYGISADPHKSSNDFASYSHDYMTENSKIKFWMPLPEPPKEDEDEAD